MGAGGARTRLDVSPDQDLSLSTNTSCSINQSTEVNVSTKQILKKTEIKIDDKYHKCVDRGTANGPLDHLACGHPMPTSAMNISDSHQDVIRTA